MAESGFDAGTPVFTNGSPTMECVVSPAYCCSDNLHGYDFGGIMKNAVMVVDDDPMAQLTVKKILEPAGLKVTTVESGDACIREVEKGFEGLILMDIMMPGMDGWDTIQALVEKGIVKGNIICMLTGKESPDERMKTLKEYILDYIRKPFDPQKFVQLVKDYLAYL
jgi:CheY-like chemotaxis protein